jgi:hypothetical protein
MPDLLAGTTVKAVDTPPSQQNTQNTSGTTTSTTYTATLTGGTAAGVSFTAPTSGRVLVCNNCEMSNSAGNVTRCSYVLRTGASIGSGTVVVAANDNNAIRTDGTSAGTIRIGITDILTGLTPGSVYNAQQAFSVSAGTGTFFNKQIAVIPLP